MPGVRHEGPLASGHVGVDEVTTRPFVADHASFVVACPTRAVRDTVESAFVDLPRGEAGSAAVIRLQAEDDGTLSVLVDGQRQTTAQSPNQALGSLVTAVTRLALDADPERLHLHCAAVARDDRGVLITARSGTGKTTLSAKLLTEGWSYGSDESVALCPDSSVVAAFPKPLMIKDGAGSPVREMAPLRVVLDPEDDCIWTVPASAIGAACVDAIEPRCIVVLTPDPRHPGRGPSQPTPIHPTDAVVAMMEQTMDAGRFGARAVVALARIAAGSHCVQMQVGPLGDAVASLEQLVREAPSAHLLRALHPEPLVGLPWHVAEHARSVLIGDRVVIHDTRGGAVSALDEAGTALWLTLLGDPPAGWGPDVLQNAAMRGFVEQLIALGFVHAGEQHGEPE